MAPHPRSSHKAHAPSQNFQPSDLELDSDYPTAQQGFTATLNQPPPQRSTNDLNLSVLQKHYPTINSILSIAPYAVIYYFSATSQTWEKSGVEGTLFTVNLYSALGIERYALIVLNRRGLENWFVEVKKEGEVEITDEYIILQGRSGSHGPMNEYEDVTTIPGGEMEIYGLWIFAEDTGSTKDMRTVNAQLIQDCAARAQSSREAIELRRAELLQQQENERVALNPSRSANSRYAAAYRQPQVNPQMGYDDYQHQSPSNFGPIGGMTSPLQAQAPYNGTFTGQSPWTMAPQQQQHYQPQQQPSLTDMLTRSASSQQAAGYGYSPQHQHQHQYPHQHPHQHPHQRQPMTPSNGYQSENAHPNVLGDLFQRAASNYRGP